MMNFKLINKILEKCENDPMACNDWVRPFKIIKLSRYDATVMWGTKDCILRYGPVLVSGVAGQNYIGKYELYFYLVGDKFLDINSVSRGFGLRPISELLNVLLGTNNWSTKNKDSIILVNSIECEENKKLFDLLFERCKLNIWTENE